MGRSSNAATIGHNHRDLNDDELGALVTSFTTKLIAATRKVDALVTDLKSARKEVSGIFKLVKRETDYDRDEFEAEIIANLDKSEEELIAEEHRRRKLQRLAGLREGEQLDLIAAIADTVDDAIAAEAAGYRAGRRADDPKRPDHIDPFFDQDFNRGWVRGQEVNAKADAMAADILARPKPGEMAAAPEDAEEEDPADPDVIRKKAAKLKAEGWTDPTPAETEFAEDVAA